MESTLPTDEQILSFITENNTHFKELLIEVGQTNILLQGIYTVMLWSIGVIAAGIVLFILYRFLRLFF